MKYAVNMLSFVLALAVANTPESAIPYFSNVRDVNVAQPDRQNYIVVDDELWNHSRADLGDLRLYDGETPVQYSLSEQSGGMSSEEVEAKILNLGSVSGQTEFDVDAGNLNEYDRIRLRIETKNFVATASVSGGNTVAQDFSTVLTPTTLYDFSSEQLGSNFVLKIPTSSFRFLHVKLSSVIAPEQVHGASIFNLREQQASWTSVGSCAAPQQKPRMTVIVCRLPSKVPLNRIQFQVAPHQVNFRRAVSVEDAKGMQLTNGEINRVRVNRGGKLVTAETMAFAISGGYDQLTVNVENGDNPPIEILSVQPQTFERRIYFDPQGKTALKLYYGDAKLSAPVYDYARFFHLDDSPAQAQLGAGMRNPQYAGRADERPWSERHTAILWAAMLLAVLVLAMLAIRGLRAQHV
jgi:hypothetical protein